MESLLQYVAPPGPCGYLPDETWRLEYNLVARLSPAEYQNYLARGWRHFGNALFRPRCQACRACQSLRVLVDRFRPDRSQKRAHKANAGEIEIRVGPPSVSRAKLELYDRYHAFQTDAKNWPGHPSKDSQGYAESFVDNPFPIQEWTYTLGGKLVGVGYVDDLPQALSAIYFFYDPDQRHRSLGTWNVLNVIAAAARRRIPHVYLGYYVDGCASMGYKARFVPNQVLGTDGRWYNFRD